MRPAASSPTRVSSRATPPMRATITATFAASPPKPRPRQSSGRVGSRPTSNKPSPRVPTTAAPSGRPETNISRWIPLGLEEAVGVVELLGVVLRDLGRRDHGVLLDL